jgi:ATP-dependent helicase/nuclease subunit A
MTIRQAKGLEFPVVVLPDLAARSGDSRTPVAHWDARLGCVARPPADEPLLFPDYGNRLWKVGETLADGREDLRTLYVACTRAQDYLILSATLPWDFGAESTGMTILKERFDWKSGACKLGGLAPERQPRVGAR